MDIRKKKQLYNLVKQMSVENKKKILSQIDISAVVKSIK